MARLEPVPQDFSSDEVALQQVLRRLGTPDLEAQWLGERAAVLAWNEPTRTPLTELPCLQGQRLLLSSAWIPLLDQIVVHAAADPDAAAAARALWDHLWQIVRVYVPQGEVPSPRRRGVVVGVLPPVFTSRLSVHRIARLQLERPVASSWPLHRAWHHWALRAHLDLLATPWPDSEAGEADVRRPLPEAAQATVLALLADRIVELAGEATPETELSRWESVGLALTGEALRQWGEQVADATTIVPTAVWRLAVLSPLLDHLRHQPRAVVAPFLRWPSREWRTALIAALGAATPVSSAEAPRPVAVRAETPAEGGRGALGTR